MRQFGTRLLMLQRSSIKMKNELPAYLSHKLRSKLNMHYAIVYGRTYLTNIADLDPELQTYNHEKAGTGIFLHRLDFNDRDPFIELIVLRSDTNTLLILLYYFDQFCTTSLQDITSTNESVDNIQKS